MNEIEIKTIQVIDRHRKIVANAIWHICDHLGERAEKHDDSKYNSDEFEGFSYFNTLDPDLEYGSEEYKKAIEKIRPHTEQATKLHYSRNSHHPEYYENIEDMSLLCLLYTSPSPRD